MKFLVWHWGRRGGGPFFAVQLAAALNQTQASAVLSLAAAAELLGTPAAPNCAWAEPTYNTATGYLVQRALNPLLQGRTLAKLRQIAPDIAVCAMPSLLDQRMLAGLHRLRIPYAVIVHDAAAHPGDRLSFTALNQASLLKGAKWLVPLSSHVEASLRQQGFGAGPQKIFKLWHPAFDFGATLPPLSHGGRPRLLFFGRLLAYKGLDLLADALDLLGAELPFTLKICGEGPASAALSRLESMRHVTVDRRWIPESELPGLLAWSDAMILPYREASQSGVAAAALAQGRLVLSTNVGGLAEQLSGHANAHLCAPEPTAIAAGLKTLFTTTHITAPVDANADWHRMAQEFLQAVTI